MINLLPLILILILGIIYVSMNKESNKIFLLLVVILVSLYLCMMNLREQFNNFAPIDHKTGTCSGINLTGKDGLNNKYTYNNLLLKDEKEPLPLASDVTIFSPVGDGIRLTNDLGHKRLPTVNGMEGTPNKMFMLAHNQCRPECCPGIYSCDRGCVCLTDEQKKFIKGINKPQIPSGDCKYNY